MAALAFLAACVVCMWLGYEWGYDMGTNCPEGTKDADKEDAL